MFNQYNAGPLATHIAPKSGPEGVRLGIYAKSTTPPPPFAALATAKAALEYPSDAPTARLERWALQSVARSILPKSRTSACMRCRVKGSSHVGVKYSPARARASYDGLQSCASVWACPICSSKISEHRRADLVALVAAHRATGGTVLLATRTFPHSRSDRLADILARLSVAETKFKSGKPWTRLVARHGVIGTVRAVEATYGSNGWHPHIHELVFLSGSADLESLRADLFARWSSAAVRAGFPAPSPAHGLDLRDGTYAARYASKWGLESELTKANAKKGRGDSLGPFDLLRVVLSSSDPLAVRTARGLFADYAAAFKGKRQLVYSRGLRARYLTAADLTDEEAAEGTEPDAVLLGRLEPTHWAAILRAGLRGQLLEAINLAAGDWSAIDEVLGAALAFTPSPTPNRT